MTNWAEKFQEKDDVSLGRILREVENDTINRADILKESYARKGNAHVIGITGPPGAGKSTLVSKLCKELNQQDISIGVVCVDPTSPFTQGALLGDRIRMQELAKLKNVFIKSLATRGSLGGLTESAADIVQVMDAFEKDVIIIETVGVGQAEFDVLDIADTVVLVNVPGLGDTLQTLKAGIMEIADLFVINQADRPGADESVKDLKMMLREAEKKDWKPWVIKTVATEEKGISRLIEKIAGHKEYLTSSGVWEEKRKMRNKTRLSNLVTSLLNKEFEDFAKCDHEIRDLIAEVERDERNPNEAASLAVNYFISSKQEEFENDKLKSGTKERTI